MKFLRSMAQKIRITTNLLHQELILSSEEKVARFILNHEDLFNELKHTKISSILNMTPETFSRILNKFKTNGLVKLDEKNQILKKDVGGLQEIYSYWKLISNKYFHLLKEKIYIFLDSIRLKFS